MAGITRVPVVVARVAVEQSISATTHTLNNTGTGCNCCHVLTGDCRRYRQSYRRVMSFICIEGFRSINERLTNKPILQGGGGVGEHALKRHEVEDLVDGVVCSNDANVPETRTASRSRGVQTHWFRSYEMNSFTTFYFFFHI